MRRGFTLIEILVAVSIFVLLVTAASGLFVSSLRAQRINLATQELLSQTSYLGEYMSRAIRMARKDLDGACTGTKKLNYEFINGCLKFRRDYEGECVCQQFCLVGERIKEIKGDRENYLTSPDLRVLAFGITLEGETQWDDRQPKVIISLEIEGKEETKIEIQTTVSQRELDIKR